MATDSTWANTTVDGRPQSLVEYVGFWARVGATLIDTALLLVVTLPLGYLAYGRMASVKSFMRGPADLLINWLLPAVLIVFLWSWLQATPGKLLVSAKIVDADTGAAPTMVQLLIRYLGYFISAIPVGLGFLWVGYDLRKQGWHDKLANTVVVRSRKESRGYNGRPG